MADNRKGRYAKLSIARKELCLDEDAFRDRLERETGKRSMRQMSIAELDKVLDGFKKDGFRPARRPAVSSRPEVRKVFALWKELAPALRSGGTRESLRAFVKRMVGVDDPNFLSGSQAGVVIEALKAWEKRIHE
ncbi:regulatory protein GemA [Gluconobacter morbifer]|nr:regulatory protein GemA [Gluconobacter morbifer]